LNESQDPQFSQVKLTGPPGQVAALVSLLGTAGRILFDTSSPPDGQGDVSRRVQLVMHHAPGAVGPGARACVTVQAVLEVEGGAWTDERTGTAVPLGAVTAALEGLDGVRRVEAQVVALAAFPEE
jgi:hypothetical protein